MGKGGKAIRYVVSYETQKGRGVKKKNDAAKRSMGWAAFLWKKEGGGGGTKK